jgi:hypothetical protein
VAKQSFRSTNFHRGTRRVIDQANEIIDEYMSQGFVMTVRQLYYQFVSRDWVENTQRDYNRIGKIVADARDSGLIDWDAIEDRTREVHTHSSWERPEDIIGAAAESFRLDPWDSQPYRPEVWIEKAALIGIVEPVVP